MSITHNQLMDLRRDVIEVATRYIGMHEVGNNRGAFVDMVNLFVGNKLSDPYCAAGLCWTAYEAGCKHAPKTGSSGAIVTWGHQHSAIVLTPSYADAFILKGDTITGYEHTALVIGGPPDALHTIEFNIHNGCNYAVHHINEGTCVNIYAGEK